MNPLFPGNKGSGNVHVCRMYGSFYERPKANVNVVTYERKGRDKTTNALSLREGFKSTQRVNLSRYLQNTNYLDNIVGDELLLNFGAKFHR